MKAIAKMCSAAALRSCLLYTSQPVDRERQAVHTERHRRLDEGEELLVLYLHIHHVKACLLYTSRCL